MRNSVAVSSTGELADQHLMASRDGWSVSPMRTTVSASRSASSPRRSTARTRAVSTRGLNGLVT